MAGKTTANTKKTTTKKTTDEVVEELNLDVKVTIKSLAGWDTGFKRQHDGVGDVSIAPDGQQRMSRNEIQAQVNGGNKLFNGIDGMGSHATIYIQDEETRKWLGFESETKKQNVFTDELVEDLFNMSQDEFEANLPKYIVTRAEKYALMEAIKRLNINDYRKIIFSSNYTGYKL